MTGASLGPHLLKIPFTIFIVASILAIAIFLFRSIKKSPRKSTAAIFLFLIFAFGALSSNFNWNKITGAALPKGHSVCSGKILDRQNADGGLLFTVAIHSCAESIDGDRTALNIKAKLFYPDLETDAEPGDEIKFRVRLRSPHDFDNPGGFPYRLWLASKGISAGGTITPSWLAVTNRGSSLSNEIRNRILAQEKASGKSFPLIAAITLGRKDFITTDLKSSFSRTGLSHLLAISGLHVGFAALIGFIIAGLAGLIFSRLYKRISRQRLGIFLSMPIIWLYVAIAGAPPSSARAAVMITLIFMFLLTGRKAHWPSVIAAAVFAMVAMNPLIVYDISFQLSVAAVIGIVAIVPKLNFHVENRLAYSALCMIAISAAAIIATAPIVARHFNEVSLMGILTNILAVPYMGFIIFPAAFISMAASLIWPFAAGALWQFTGLLAQPLMIFVEHADKHSNRFILHLSPTAAEIALYYLTIATIIYWQKIRFKKTVAVSIAITLAIINMGVIMPKKFSTHFIDVGQGNATLVQFSSGKKVLIDGGGIKGSDLDTGKRMIAPALWNMGIRTVDDLILTHPHHDHYKGLAYIAEHFGSKRLFTNGQSAPESEADDWNEFMKRIRATNIEIIELDSSSNPLDYKSGKIHILHPPRGLSEKLDPNDASLVLMVAEGNKRILLTGDIMKDGEAILLASKQDLKADVFQAAHHGSITSNTVDFLKAVNPETVIISVGQNNPYGMPDEPVLERFKSMNAKIRRTDEEGMITYP